MTPPRKLHTPDGRPVRLGRLLASGREGSVHDHAGSPAVAVKLWHAPTLERAMRLRAMLELAPAVRVAGKPVTIAWPIDAVLDARGEAVGFLMPKAGGRDPQRVYNLLTRAEREHLVPNLRFDLLMLLALGIALGVAHLHQNGVVVCDLNELNVLVSADGHITFVDCDSMQFTDVRGTVHYSALYRDEYLAPEFVGVDLTRVPRTQASDCFALSVLVFRILMDGFEPFAAVPKGRSGTQTLEQRAASGTFVFCGNHRQWRVPPGAPSIEVIPDDVFAVLADTLACGSRHAARRATAQDLAAELKSGVRVLVQCRGPRNHLIPTGRDRCPWCEHEQRHGLAPHQPGPAMPAAKAAGAKARFGRRGGWRASAQSRARGLSIAALSLIGVLVLVVAFSSCAAVAAMRDPAADRSLADLRGAR